MKAFVVFNPNTDYARTVTDYLRDFERRTAHRMEQIDPETREGADICRLYDIVEYPTIVATTDEGVLQNLWRGLPLPTIDEVSYYVQ